MARNLTPITKLSRREGVALGKEKRFSRRPYPPGVHGVKFLKTKPRMSSFGKQLREKQKAKRLYGMLERQFRRCFTLARGKEGNTGTILVQMLEKRLDNVVYRLGIAQTRPQARQMVSHGFITVNGKKLDVPSAQVGVGDLIAVKETKRDRPLIKQSAERINKHQPPTWLHMDVAALTGKVVSEPNADEVEKMFDPTLIVELYSR